MFLLLVSFGVLFFLIISTYRKKKQFPPGPLPFPLIGNLPQLIYYMYKYGGIVEVMKEMKKVYGPMFTLWMGPDPSVHICSLDLAQETMVKRGHEFVDRWAPYLLWEMNAGKGIINANGALWSEQRRFMLHSFRNFGLGRGIMEERIMMEYHLRAKDLDKRIVAGDNEIEAFPFVELMVGSIINRILFSERLEKDKETEFFQLRKEQQLFFDFSTIDFYAGMKWLWKIPYLNQRWSLMLRIMDRIKDFLGKQVDSRLREVETGEHIVGEPPEDYVDCFLAKMSEEKDDPNTTFTKEALVSNILDLWSAGQDTTSTTLLSGLVHLLNDPMIMEESRRELVSVTQGKRALSLTDRKKTPYLNALITEVQRHASIVLVNLFRKTFDDIRVNGHSIPKDTAITAEVSVIMENDDLFFDSHKFDPIRYLSNPDLEKHVLPFSIGKRSCPGESLARAELYLILGNLLLDYKLERIGEKPLKDTAFSEGFFKMPESFRMRVAKLN